MSPAFVKRATFSTHLVTCRDESCPGCEPDTPISRARRKIAELEKKLEETKRLPFVTGSRVYGTPRPDSDVDLVVVADFDDDFFVSVLWDFADDRDGSDCGSLHFEKLNLISVEPDEYDRWKRARDRCLAEKPVTRERAIEIHKEERAGRP
jgi:predicted nucleotidyltransferase